MHPALLSVIAVFALLGHGYLWIAIVNRLHGWAGPYRLIDLLTLWGLLAFLLLPPMVFWQWWQTGSRFMDSGYITPAAEAARAYVVVVAFFGFGKLIAKFIAGWQLDDPRVVTFKRRDHVPSLQHPALRRGRYAKLLRYVPGNQVLRLTIEHKRLALPRLPAELVGLRIAHVSDWHLTGRIDGAWFEHVANTVNSLKPDVVMVTGDIIENDACRPWLADSLGMLTAKFGVYFILGNHDYYINAAQTVADLEQMGLTYVGGEHFDVEWNGAPVTIVGNELPWNRRLSSFDRRAQSFKISLLHTPDQFDWACLTACDLALAGHTHGGQVCFPILGAVAAPSLHGTRLASGTFRRGQTVMHVTRGISGETPMRWFCPPEIAMLELARARG